MDVYRSASHVLRERIEALQAENDALRSGMRTPRKTLVGALLLSVVSAACFFGAGYFTAKGPALRPETHARTTVPASGVLDMKLVEMKSNRDFALADAAPPLEPQPKRLAKSVPVTRRSEVAIGPAWGLPTRETHALSQPLGPVFGGI